ncbi:MAG: hypothetical protein MR467_06815 [Bacillales bacterium]|nr:hypothetical protein [Mollicutes bacterium]MCI7213831.1 hypothetical protein [Bacillales bacterium]
MNTNKYQLNQSLKNHVIESFIKHFNLPVGIEDVKIYKPVKPKDNCYYVEVGMIKYGGLTYNFSIGASKPVTGIFQERHYSEVYIINSDDIDFSEELLKVLFYNDEKYQLSSVWDANFLTFDCNPKCLTNVNKDIYGVIFDRSFRIESRRKNLLFLKLIPITKKEFDFFEKVSEKNGHNFIVVGYFAKLLCDRKPFKDIKGLTDEEINANYEKVRSIYKRISMDV